MRGRLGLDGLGWVPAGHPAGWDLAGQTAAGPVHSSAAGEVGELVAEQVHTIRSGQRQRIKALITPSAPHTPSSSHLSSGRRSRAASEGRCGAADETRVVSRDHGSMARPDHSSQNAAVRHIERTRSARRARSATPHSGGRARSVEQQVAGGRRSCECEGGRQAGQVSSSDGSRGLSKSREAVTRTPERDYSAALRLAGTAAAARRGVSSRWVEAAESCLPGVLVGYRS